MAKVYLYGGKPLLISDTIVAIGSACCCDGSSGSDDQACCCDQITLNDLLYGDKEYSWPVIDPGGKNRQPDHGANTPAPVVAPPAAYTEEGTQWVKVDDWCYELTTVVENPELAFDPLVEGPIGCGQRLALVDGQWVEIQRHCFGKNIRPRQGCLRWVCQCYKFVGGVLTKTCESVYGGETTNNKNLPELVADTLGEETEEGCFVYTVEFWGWTGPGFCGSGKSGFIPGDDMYSIHRTKITSCQ